MGVFANTPPLCVFNDPTKGYLVGDKCVFGAEVFVIKYSGAGELLPQPKNLINAIYTWKISNFSRSIINSVPAASFTLQDCKWKLELYPKGYPADEHSDLALGIRLDDTTKRVYADYKLKIKNQADGKDVMATGSTGFGGISKSKVQ